MYAAVLHAKGNLRFELVETPVPGPGEVLIRVRATGICGSDVPRVLGEAAHYYPIILGHEFSGDVAALGPGVAGLEVGQRVTAAPLVPCHRCADCQRGDYALCRQYSFVGSRAPGSFAQYVVVPAINVVPLGEGVSYEQGALTEPATVALHGLMRLPYRGGEDVAILGGGTIGLLTAQWARIFGARQVCVFDIDPDRLALARRLGADAVFNTREEGFLEAAMSATGGRGFSFIYETAGAVETMALSFRLAGSHAGVCFIGTPTRDITLPPALLETILRREFTLTGSWMSYSAPFPGREWALAAHFFATGQLSIDGLVYKRMPLADIAAAFELYSTPGAVKGKILLVDE